MQANTENRPETISGEPHSDFFETLNALRDSGAMNMMGAPRWLEENYDLNSAEAKAVFISWTESFQ